MLMGLIAAIAVIATAGFTSVRLVDVSTDAMNPSLHEGERTIAFRRFGVLSLKRGELIAFAVPSDLQKIEVRRVVGVPGDRIQVRADRLVLNGKTVFEPYVRISSKEPGQPFPTGLNPFLNNNELGRLQSQMYAEWVKGGSLVVPEGHYFVLSDNRSKSTDSRLYGPVPKGNIVGRPLYVYEPRPVGSPRRLLDSYVIVDPE
jgi:signal peptidase I